MEDTDWDLHAVVRSCTTARASTSSSLAPTAPNSVYPDGLEEPEASWMWNWVKRDQEVEESSSHHHVPLVSRGGAFHDSEELYQPFLFASPTTTTYHTAMTAAASSSYAPSGTIIPNSPTSFISDFGGGSITSSGQHQLQQQQNNLLPANINTAQTNNPHFNPGFPPVSGLRRFPKPQLIKHPKLERPVDQPEELIPRLKPVTSVGPAMQIPRELIRPRKGKTPVKKVVCHLAENNLSSSDLWAWRKYGQKPIKGSPHPRNYYRCSSSKGCSARKQVERSVVDPDMFVVTYCGVHTHPRPTHRNSLAGSTRNKAAAVATTPPPKAKKGPESPPVRLMPAHGGDDDDGDNEQAANSISNSGDGDKASEEAEEDEEMEEDDDEDEDEDEEEFVVSSSDDIFLGMKPLGRSGSGGNTLGTSLGDGASVDDGSSWEAAGCSSSAGATLNGGF